MKRRGLRNAAAKWIRRSTLHHNTSSRWCQYLNIKVRYDVPLLASSKKYHRCLSVINGMKGEGVGTRGAMSNIRNSNPE